MFQLLTGPELTIRRAVKAQRDLLPDPS